jgi:anti-sigma regulatory factor (Ser/Thr protein kinase)
VAGDTYRREFAADPVQVRAARRDAMKIVRAWGLDCEEVGLVADELATNAVLHGRSPFTLILERDDTRVVIQVVDENPRLPTTVKTLPSLALSGRGLVIVDRVSADWGVVPLSDGKVVWAKLECRGVPDVASRGPVGSVR